MKKTVNLAALTLTAVLFVSGCFGNDPPSGTHREKEITEKSETQPEPEPAAET